MTGSVAEATAEKRMRSAIRKRVREKLVLTARAKWMAFPRMSMD
jgi:hypothetical protein